MPAHFTHKNSLDGACKLDTWEGGDHSAQVRVRLISGSSNSQLEVASFVEPDALVTAVQLSPGSIAVTMGNSTAFISKAQAEQLKKVLDVATF